MQTIMTYARIAAHISSGFAALAILLGLLWFQGNNGAAFWLELGAGISGALLAMLWTVRGAIGRVLWATCIVVIAAYGVSRLSAVAEFGASSIFLPSVLLVAGLALGIFAFFGDDKNAAANNG